MTGKMPVTSGLDRFGEFGAIHGLAVHPHAAFKVSAVVQVVLGSLLVGNSRTREIGGSGQQFECLLEILLHVRPKVQYSAWLQDSLNVLDKLVGHHATLTMTSFPPGVREIDVHGRNGCGADPFAKDPQGIATDHLAVVDELSCQPGSRVTRVGRRTSMPRKSRSGCSTLALHMNRPLPEPTSISMGACRPNSVRAHSGLGSCSSSRYHLLRSSSGSIFFSARRPMIKGTEECRTKNEVVEGCR